MRALGSAIGARQSYGGCAFLTPASVRFSACQAKRCAEGAPVEFPGARQELACPVPACSRGRMTGVSPERAVALHLSRLTFHVFSLPPLAGEPVLLSSNWLVEKRKSKSCVAFPSDSLGNPVGRGCNVKPFAR